MAHRRKSSRRASDGAERRVFARTPYGAWVEMVGSGRQEFCLARDISMGGLYLRANPPPRIGERVRLLLVVENDPDPMELQGTVARRSEADPGFAVRFDALDPALAARLRAVVEDAEKALWKGGPGPGR